MLNMATKRTDEKAWQRIKNRVQAGTKGGRAGQWSAIKANLATAEYKSYMKKKGKKPYVGKKPARNSLTKWNKEKWRTKSGKPSLETGERFLPSKAIKSLSDKEYRQTSAKKRRDMAKGKQFSSQPEKIKKKTSKAR